MPSAIASTTDRQLGVVTALFATPGQLTQPV
jgi:hypothetical protein